MPFSCTFKSLPLTVDTPVNEYWLDCWCFPPASSSPNGQWPIKGAFGCRLRGHSREMANLYGLFGCHDWKDCIGALPVPASFSRKAFVCCTGPSAKSCLISSSWPSATHFLDSRDYSAFQELNSKACLFLD